MLTTVQSKLAEGGAAGGYKCYYTPTIRPTYILIAYILVYGCADRRHITATYYLPSYLLTEHWKRKKNHPLSRRVHLCAIQTPAL